MLFMTVEDETGIANGILWPDRFEAQRRTIMSASGVTAEICSGNCHVQLVNSSAKIGPKTLSASSLQPSHRNGFAVGV